jgi:two-component system response regulator MtrA
VREAVKLALQRDGHTVETAAGGNEAIQRWRTYRPDLILLDVMLPEVDGIEVCRHVRSEDSVPVIMLTARADPIDVVLGLESGADDYVVKPFETRVLLARIKAVLRRRGAAEPRVLRLGKLVIDTKAMTVTKGDSEIALSPTEFRVLTELARRPGQVFTREMLLERVWEYDFLGDSRLVDVCIQRLRSKIEDDPSAPKLIVTVRGAGYRASSGSNPRE